SCSSRGSTSSRTPRSPTSARSPTCSRRSTAAASPVSTTSRCRCSEALGPVFEVTVSAEPEPPDDLPEPPEPDGRLRPMSPAGLSIFAAVGLVGGWVFHQVTDTSTSVPPQVPWAQPLALFLVACILFGTAWSTRRTIAHTPGRLSPHQAVNRLVLARACAY